jgi:hypothetical protein
VNGPLIVDDVEIMVHAAIDGVGLVRLLPPQRQLPAALTALIETVRFRPEKEATP